MHPDGVLPVMLGKATPTSSRVVSTPGRWHPSPSPLQRLKMCLMEALAPRSLSCPEINGQYGRPALWWRPSGLSTPTTVKRVFYLALEGKVSLHICVIVCVRKCDRLNRQVRLELISFVHFHVCSLPPQMLVH